MFDRNLTHKVMSGPEAALYYGKLQREREQTVPPLGLIPKWIRDEERLREVDAAMLRYAIAEEPIPTEWREERDELVVRLNAFYNGQRQLLRDHKTHKETDNA